MKARNILALFVALLLLYTAIVTATGVGERKYTHEELMAMPPLELYNLFRENGLAISEKLKHIPDRDMAEYFRLHFELLLQGGVMGSNPGYYELMQDMREIYPKITIRAND